MSACCVGRGAQPRRTTCGRFLVLPLCGGVGWGVWTTRIVQRGASRAAPPPPPPRLVPNPPPPPPRPQIQGRFGHSRLTAKCTECGLVGESTAQSAVVYCGMTPTVGHLLQCESCLPSPLQCPRPLCTPPSGNCRSTHRSVGLSRTRSATEISPRPSNCPWASATSPNTTGRGSLSGTGKSNVCPTGAVLVLDQNLVVTCCGPHVSCSATCGYCWGSPRASSTCRSSE